MFAIQFPEAGASPLSESPQLTAGTTAEVECMSVTLDGVFEHRKIPAMTQPELTSKIMIPSTKKRTVIVSANAGRPCRSASFFRVVSLNDKPCVYQNMGTAASEQLACKELCFEQMRRLNWTAICISMG
jgi:hypothetical protein